MIRIVSILLLTVTFPRSAFAQEMSPKDLVDAGLSQLRGQQADSGSYDDDIITTSKALLAYRESHRKYGPSDGPFVRSALSWLGQQVAAASVAELQWVSAVSETYDAKLAPDLHRVLALRQQELSPNPGEAQISLDLESWQSVIDHLPRPTPAAVALPLARQLAVRAPESETARDHWTAQIQGVVWAEGLSPFIFQNQSAAAIADQCRLLSVLAKHQPAKADSTAAPPALAGQPPVRTADLAADARIAMLASLEFMATQHEQGRFGFDGRADAGITAMALTAILRTCNVAGLTVPDYVDSGLDWLVSLQHEDGSIHEGSVKVYVTSAAIMALSERGRKEHEPIINQAAEYLRVVQADGGEGYEESSDWAYGGIGYGGDLRPDLSNTQFGLEALQAAGVSSDDEAFQRALIFLQRCQNNPEVNTMAVERSDGKTVVAGTDGGAVYYPGDSKAGLVQGEDGTHVARSYGSMTYALLKCYLFAGVPKEDPRVQSLLGWISENFTVEYNPGFDRQNFPGSEYQGLYYYYFTMAKALDLCELNVVHDSEGNRHVWRRELMNQLLDSGFREGFWSNRRSPRWWEEIPVLATSYSLIAMSYCLED